jgi:hypothetical protein
MYPASFGAPGGGCGNPQVLSAVTKNSPRPMKGEALVFDRSNLVHRAAARRIQAALASLNAEAEGS